MTKLALINDIHIGARNDSPVFLEAHKKFFTELFIPTLEKEGINEVIILGDLFDRRKYINFNTEYEVKRFLFDVLLSKNIKVHILVGNHDVTFKNTNKVNSPDLVLNEYSNILVYIDPVVLSYEECDIGLTPWINIENQEKSLEFIKTFSGDILMGHYEINGFEMHKNGGVCLDGLEKKLFNNYDMVLSGHFHEPSINGNIRYLGSPLQFTWADYDCKRGFHILDLETRNLTYVENPDRMFHKIFYDEDLDILNFNFSELKDRVVRVLVGEKKDQHKFDLFIDQIQRVNPFQMDIIDNTMNQFSEEFDINLVNNEDTMTIVESYIDSLDLDFDDVKIKSLFKELYLEALAELD